MFSGLFALRFQLPGRHEVFKRTQTGDGELQGTTLVESRQCSKDRLLLGARPRCFHNPFQHLLRDIHCCRHGHSIVSHHSNAIPTWPSARASTQLQGECPLAPIRQVATLPRTCECLSMPHERRPFDPNRSCQGALLPPRRRALQANVECRGLTPPDFRRISLHLDDPVEPLTHATHVVFARGRRTGGDDV